MHRSTRRGRCQEAIRQPRDCTDRTTTPAASKGPNRANLRPGKPENRSFRRRIGRFRRVAFSQRVRVAATCVLSDGAPLRYKSYGAASGPTLPEFLAPPRDAKMAKIYTRTGDGGETALFAGGRIRKDDPRLAAIGTIDELNAQLGVARAELNRAESVATDLDQFCERVQHQLFNLGAELAMPRPGLSAPGAVRESDVARLEEVIDRWEQGLEPLREFILPGGSPAAAQLHLARCVCRRAERLLVGLAQGEAPVRAELLRYLNRMSDALFVAARAANRSTGMPDVKWRPGD
jgi:cob(I)alamin adenosyltransferase